MKRRLVHLQAVSRVCGWPGWTDSPYTGSSCGSQSRGRPVHRSWQITCSTVTHKSGKQKGLDLLIIAPTVEARGGGVQAQAEDVGPGEVAARGKARVQTDLCSACMALGLQWPDTALSTPQTSARRSSPPETIRSPLLLNSRAFTQP